MRKFTQRFQVNAPIEAVADFHHSTEVIRKLTPPPVFVSFNNAIPPVAEGSRADFTLWLGPIPVRWVAVHSQVDPQRGFTDTQLEGPFQSWVHRHSFEPLDSENTLVTDEIQAVLGVGFPKNILSRLMWLGVPGMFRYRAWRTRHILKADIKLREQSV